MCFFFKKKTVYDMRISYWSSDVCSSDLDDDAGAGTGNRHIERPHGATAQRIDQNRKTLTNECQRGMVVRATGEQHQQNASDIESRDPEGWQHEKQAISNGMGCHQSSTGTPYPRPLSGENSFGNDIERDSSPTGPHTDPP